MSGLCTCKTRSVGRMVNASTSTTATANGEDEDEENERGDESQGMEREEYCDRRS